MTFSLSRLLASLAALLLVSSLALAQSPCSPSPCGVGARCDVQRGSNAICSCPRGQTGDPFIRCEPFSSGSSGQPVRGSGGSGGCRSCGASGAVSSGGFGGGSSDSRFDEWECYKLSDCDFDKQCQGTPGRCIDPCTNDVNTGRPPCGTGADCEATRYKAICSCPKTHTGDPFVSCRPFTPADLCSPSPCGANSYCEPGKDTRTGEDRPVCLCHEGFRGNGVTGCTRGDCISLRHEMCPNNKACYDSTCVDPCGPTFCGGNPCCAPSAQCQGVDHKAECSCPPGTAGEPRSGGECRAGGQAQVRGGSGSGSLCSPNPCGVDAECNVGSDRSGGARPVCTCPRGYRGNALVQCRRGECFSDSECPDHKACFDYRCKDPCKGPDTSCGLNANCRVVNHASVCSCPEGYQGDPITSCNSIRSRNRNNYY